MTKHLTSFEGSAVDIAKYFESQPTVVQAPVSAEETGAWRDLLGQIIEREVLPRLRNTQPAPDAGPEGIADQDIDPAVINAFVGLIIADDVERLREVADRVILYTGGRDALLNRLLAPAARLLGRMWEADTCDFMTVTTGVYRLNQIMRETEAAAAPTFSRSFEHHILLLPAPGEQHSFGITMVADSFRAAGWCVRTAPAVSRSQLLRLVKDEWFDVVGLSVSTERCLKGLPACIRAVRAASCNQRSFVMLGGYAVNCHPERARFLGADGVTADAATAVQLANDYMETKVTDRFGQYTTKPIDAGRAL